MKKIYSIIALSVYAAFCGSCSKDVIVPLRSNGWQDMVIEASQESPSTKTSVDDETGFVYWNPGDAINVFNGEIGLMFVSRNNAKAKVASFANSYSVIIGSNEGDGIVSDGLYGLYPFNPDASSDGSSVTTTLPDVQTAVEGSFDDNIFITLGKTEGVKPEMGFYNVCGGVRFRVSETGIYAIHFKGNNGESLAGKVKLAFDEYGYPFVEEVIDGKNELTLECQGGFKPNVWYYLVTLPLSLTSGYTVTYEKKSYAGTIVSTESTDIKRSTFGSLDKKDADADWILTKVHIPDTEFNSYCLSHFDLDGDGILSQDEIEDVTEMEIYDYDVVSLEGIELFTNLTSLIYWGDFHYENNNPVADGKLTSADFSNNTKLERLELLLHHVTSLDLSENKELSYVDCSYNALTELCISGLTKLEFLDCGRNQLTSLDVSQNTALITLSCYSNQLSSLDVSNNTALTTLQCSNNQLTSLDVSNNTALTVLDCGDNSLTELDLSDNTELSNLGCYGNQLTSLDVRDHTALVSLSCGYNYLTSLDVSNNTALTNLNCQGNQLISLDVTKNTLLGYLRCYENQLKTLDVSTCLNLYMLAAQSNPNMYSIYLMEGQTISRLSKDNQTELIYISGR